MTNCFTPGTPWQDASSSRAWCRARLLSTDACEDKKTQNRDPKCKDIVRGNWEYFDKIYLVVQSTSQRQVLVQLLEEVSLVLALLVLLLDLVLLLALLLPLEHGLGLLQLGELLLESVELHHHIDLVLIAGGCGVQEITEAEAMFHPSPLCYS